MQNFFGDVIVNADMESHFVVVLNLTPLILVPVIVAALYVVRSTVNKEEEIERKRRIDQDNRGRGH